jgi:hypothetical protein
MHSYAPVVSLPLYRAQKRRQAAAIARAHARRRRLTIAVLLAAGILTGYALHRDHHLPELPASIRR